MSEIKRPISQVTSSSSGSDHYDKKHHTKPGRKPIDTEPKSKRTAQNRAAQRAYRERKEKKMRDLEDRVRLLESENVKVNTELDFLRAQVDLLKKELARYRGSTDSVDINSQYSGSRINKIPSALSGKHKEAKSSLSECSSNKSFASDLKSGLSLLNTSPESNGQSSAYFPWSKDSNQEARSNKQVPDLVSGSSSSTSPLDGNMLITPGSLNDFIGSYPQKDREIQDSTGSEKVPTFEEQLNPICLKLSDACGTKDSPIPKDKMGDYTYESPLATLNHYILSNKNNNAQEGFDFQYNKDINFNFDEHENSYYDPLSLLNDNTFDVNLVFEEGINDYEKKNENPHSSVAGLTTEESAYDPLTDGKLFEEFLSATAVSPLEKDSNRPEISPKDLTLTYGNENRDDDNEDLDEIVPAPEATLKCSEIWDRIISHPKYTEIDIDSLCTELKSKAKCSERGAVLNSSDVNKLLELSVSHAEHLG